MVALFLTGVLALPLIGFRHPALVSAQAVKTEEQTLKDWLRKNNPEADVFITPHGQHDKLKEYGWERVPFNWRGQEIWIQRKPKSDQKRTLMSA